jgi:hypothetical protein
VTKEESNSGNNNDNTLKDDERNLMLDQLTIVSLAELSNTVDTSSEDENDGSRETNKESNHAPTKSLSLPRSPVSDHVVGEGDDESNEDNDLEGKTGHGDINTNGAVAFGGHGTTSGLEDQTDDIEGDEDPDEELRLKTGELGREVVDCFREGDVDGGSVEDGSDRETNNLDHESVERKGIVPHHDTANIANDFRHAAQKHTSHETPALPSNTEVDVHDTDERKENDKDDVGSERRPIAVETPVDGTSVEIARRVRAKGVLGVDGVVVRHVVGWLMFCVAIGWESEWAIYMYERYLTIEGSM